MPLPFTHTLSLTVPLFHVRRQLASVQVEAAAFQRNGALAVLQSGMWNFKFKYKWKNGVNVHP